MGGLEYNEGVYLLGYTLVPSSLQFSLELVHVRASSTSATAYGVITKLEDDDDVDVFHCRPGYGANVEPSRFRPGSSRLIPLSVYAPAGHPSVHLGRVEDVYVGKPRRLRRIFREDSSAHDLV